MVPESLSESHFSPMPGPSAGARQSSAGTPPGRRGRFFGLFFGFLCTAAWLLTGVSAAAAQKGLPETGRVIVVGGDQSYPPYEFLDKNGQPAGYNVELTRAIAAVMGMDVEVRLGSWGQMRKALDNGSVDILEGMAYLDSRLKEVDYSPPHAIVYQSIWTRNDALPIRTVRDLRGKDVIIMRNSVMHDFMLQHRELGAHLIFTDTLAQALKLLSAGKGDCALVAKLPGEYLMREMHLDNISPVARPIAEQAYGYAVKKGHDELLNRFDEGLAILKKSGQFKKIRAKWLGVLEPAGITWSRVLQYGGLVIGPLLLILGGTVVWSRTLQKEVAIRTAALGREVAERQRAMEKLKVHQQQLVQADKMASLGILVAGVAHEINNPNGLILLNTPLLQGAFDDAQQILEDHYCENGDFTLGWLPYSRMRDEIPHLFSEMLDGAKRIKRIVEDLKDFARQDDSDLCDTVQVNQVVETAVRLVENSIRKATSRFEVAYAEALPPVRGNPQRIEQVVVNLVLNACQALDRKEQGVFVRTRHDPEAGTVVFEVRDEGRGVSPENLSHLCDPFFTTKRESGGTGLGLSISDGIVKEHGGTLDFTSEPGRGLTVVMSLPAFKEQRP